MWPPRSLLFVPSTQPERMEKAASYGPDGLIFDLEDTVPPAAKGRARRNIVAHLDHRPSLPIWVRIESAQTEYWQDDLQAVVHPKLAGVFLPKVEDAAEVSAVDAYVGALERERGLAEGSILFLPMAETALGIRNLYAILRGSSRVVATGFAGAEDADLIRDLGATWRPDGLTLVYAREKVLLDARAAGIEIIIDGVFANLDDDDGLSRDTDLGRQIGYTGKMVIHPNQLPIVHEVYALNNEKLEYFRGLVEVFRSAELEGNAAVRYRGKLVDYAMFKQAERFVVLADNLNPS